MRDINFDKKIIIKFFLLSILFLLLFYFFIFKNILLYNEIKENINNEEIRYEKLNLEREIIFKAFGDKKEQFNILKEKLNKLSVENEDKDNFDSVSDILSYINKNIEKNSLDLISFARSSKRNKNIEISLNLKGKEEKIRNFIRDVENGQKRVSLSKNYFKFFTEKNLLQAKLSLSYYIKNLDRKKHKSLEKELNEGLEKIKKKIFLERVKKSESSLMRIGNKKYYRSFNEEKSSIDNNKINKKKKEWGADKSEKNNI